jgi:formate--tetrahydrofolate ligase
MHRSSCAPPRPLIDPAHLLPWGPGRAKVSLDAIAPPRAKYVVVTAVTPTAHGEGKTVTAIGLVDALWRLGWRAVGTLRQSALGPYFGVKGAGTGGGAARLDPASGAELHLTGDEHAVAAAHNLLAAYLDNHLFHGNTLGIAPEGIEWLRASTLSDRALREVTLALGDGRTRDSAFLLTPASEVMAVLALARDPRDLADRLARIVVASDHHGAPVTALAVGADTAMALLLREATLPNLVHTTEGSPVLVHAGPFANIASGNCSVLADRVAMGLAEVVVTEAGFGAELGFEKLVDLKVPAGGPAPDAAVLVASVRALRASGGGELATGLANLEAMLRIVGRAGVPAVVALNRFADDTADDVAAVARFAATRAEFAICEAWTRGGEGAWALARAVVDVLAGAPFPLHPFQVLGATIRDNLHFVATRVYGAEGVDLSPQAEADLARLDGWGFGSLPVCVAKTPRSLSHDPALLGAPEGFRLPVGALRLAAGAGHVIAIAGNIQLLPALPSHPRTEWPGLDAMGSYSAGSAISGPSPSAGAASGVSAASHPSGGDQFSGSAALTSSSPTQ